MKVGFFIMELVLVVPAAGSRLNTLAVALFVNATPFQHQTSAVGGFIEHSGHLIARGG
jgi:hypothetical protein